MDDGLGGIVATTNLALSAPDEHALRQAIEKPAQGAGVQLEPGLATQIVADVRDQPGGLPLMQFVLRDLVQHRESGSVTQVEYAASGGVTGALSRRASDVYDALESADREVAEQIFLRLVTVSEDAGDVRHRVRRSEMHFLGGDVGAVDRVLDAFGTARLLTIDRDPVTRGPTVEIAHEALLRAWDTYRMWIDDRREDLFIRRRLLQALEEWLEAGRDVDHLPTRGRLTQFEEWADTTSLPLSDHEREFLDAATTRRDVERSDRRKRRQRITAGFAAAAVIASVLAVAAWVQRGVATTEASLATARALILEAEKNVDVDPELGMLLALEAIDSFEGAGEVPASATNVLRRGIEADRVIVRLPGGEFLWVAPDGSTLATASESGDGVAIRDIETGELLETVAFGDGDPVPFLFMGTNELFFEFEHARLRVSRSTTLVWEDLPGAVPTSVQSWWIDVSASGDLVAVQQDETLQIWDRHTGQVLNALPTSTAGGLRFLDETTLVHIPSEDGDSIDLAIIDVITGETLHSAGGLSFPPLLFSLSPDGRRLATADGSFLVAMIDLETGEETWVSDGTERAFVPLWLHGGNELLVGGEDLLKAIDADAGDLLRQITGHEGGTWAYSLIAGSDLVASSGKDDNQTLILDVSGAGPPEAARFVTPVLDTFLVSNDGTKLLLGTPSPLVVDAMSGHMVSEQDGPVFREDSGEWVPAVSPGGLFRAGETTAEASYMWSEQDQAVVYTAPDGWWVHGISPDGAHAVISKDLEPTALAAPATARPLPSWRPEVGVSSQAISRQTGP